MAARLWNSCLDKPRSRATKHHSCNPVQTCVKQPLKNSQTKILMTNGGLMKVESIAECSPVSVESIAGAFCNTFDLH